MPYGRIILVIVDCGVYQNGERIPHPPGIDAAVQEVRARPGSFCWIGLFEPTPEEMEQAAKAFGLHPLAVEDALESHQRPKVEVYQGGNVLVVLKSVWYDAKVLTIGEGEIAIFAGPDYVITVRHGKGLELAETRADLEKHAQPLEHGPSGVLYAICDRVVDEYIEVAADLDLEVDRVEQSVFSPERTSDAQAVFALKRQVLALRRAVAPLIVPMNRLESGLVEGIHSSTRAFFRDVSDHVNRVSDQVDALDDLLTSILQAHLARVSVQQNEDMRRISAWVAICAVPTMIAGVYGMNFDFMPETHWVIGYPLVLLVMVTACTLLYRGFKRAGWL